MWACASSYIRKRNLSQKVDFHFAFLLSTFLCFIKSSFSPIYSSFIFLGGYLLFSFSQSLFGSSLFISYLNWIFGLRFSRTIVSVTKMKTKDEDFKKDNSFLKFCSFILLNRAHQEQDSFIILVFWMCILGLRSLIFGLCFGNTILTNKLIVLLKNPHLAIFTSDISHPNRMLSQTVVIADLILSLWHHHLTASYWSAITLLTG